MIPTDRMPKHERRDRCAWGARACLWLALAGAGIPAEAVDDAACAGPAEMPALATVPPVPLPGTWRGKGFGDKRKLDVEIQQCGNEIDGMIGVQFRYAVKKPLVLERDEEGRYKAQFTYAERGAAVVVTWDLVAESESRVTGRMSIMGRTDNVEADLLDPRPYPEMPACECAAVRARREEIDRMLGELRTGRPGTATEGGATGWTTDPETCAVRPALAAGGFPTQASYDAVARAGWKAELVHRDRCCAARGTAEEGGTAAYTEWMQERPAEQARDETAALGVQLEVLDAWLDERCPAADAPR